MNKSANIERYLLDLPTETPSEQIDALREVLKTIDNPFIRGAGHVALARLITHIDFTKDVERKMLDNHDCHLSPEDGCAVCSRYLPDYVPTEEEEEEECFDVPYDILEGELDADDLPEYTPFRIEPAGWEYLPGHEERLALDTVFDEEMNGEKPGEVIIH